MSQERMAFANILTLACGTKVEVCQTHPRGYSYWRGWRWGDIQDLDASTAGLYVDDRFQSAHYCAPHDKRRRAKRDSEVPV